jgi:hypothetical protein
MAFGQSAGPPATSKQLRELLELVIEAGHLDFRDARGPLGLTQRQAAGKFTRDEADELIARLQEEMAAGSEEGPPPADPQPSSGARPKRGGATTSATDDGRLRHVPSEELAAELQRRGWAVLEP